MEAQHDKRRRRHLSSIEGSKLIDELVAIPGKIKRILEQSDAIRKIAEKYARCSNKDWSVGGSLWAYWFIDTGVPWHAAFGVSWDLYSIGPGSKFQVRPRYDGECDPILASTGHHSMVIGLAENGETAAADKVLLELAFELEQKGYGWIEAEVAGARA